MSKTSLAIIMALALSMSPSLLLAESETMKVNCAQYFKEGFPLEAPSILMPWGTTIEKFADSTQALWHSDRYYWRNVTYLGGLEYPLMSDFGIEKNETFQKITALIGLTEDGLWSDNMALDGYKKVSTHLIGLLGEPSEKSTSKEIEDQYMSWTCGRVTVFLTLFEQFSYRCHLSIKYKG